MSVCKVEGREDKCDLTIITSNPLAIGNEVVRWCKHCGAVVVDQDYDDRTNPGFIKPMEFPTLAKENKNKI
jgi:hypothetical protein